MGGRAAGALLEPVAERGAKLGWIVDLAAPAVLVADAKDAVARRGADVDVDGEGENL